ncbi:M20 family metallopeptidase [Pseudonocardia nematodicida]|uniref:Peptidase M20 domain-containing protein 2 n=1 Tax=Pseudonocardia nematodicida TaxID=1206997 RepID=A0ABV1K6H2_9PSEU
MTQTDPDTASPVPPSDAHDDAVARRTADLAAAAEPITSPYDGAPEPVRTAVTGAVESLSGELLELSHSLHADPETAFTEHRAAAAVADLLERHGIACEIGVHGLDTALRASAGSGDYTVAVLAEYDALPGIGHACGHNVICAAGVGAFLALARTLAAEDATVLLLGTPAEEGGGGKETMARDGAFDGVDAAVMLHPFAHDVADHPFLGRRQLDVVYHGIAAHASAQPHRGRNALDAVVLGYQGVAMMRQHLPDADRIHGIITDGGQAPNVVPERASARYYLRSQDPESLRDMTTRVEAIAVGAAAMTGCGYTLTWDPKPAYLPIRHNRALAARWAVHQAERGRTVYPRGVIPDSETGSTDLGNVSMRIPAIHPMIAIAEPGTALHTTGFAEAAGGPGGDRAVVDGAAGLASVVADLVHDAGLRDAVAAEFAEAGGPVDVPGYFD